MNVAMVSEHASPLAILGGADAGGQNVHVAELSAALVRAGHRVTVYTRRDDRRLPYEMVMPSGVLVRNVEAGPARHVPKDELLPYMDAFAERLARGFAADVPDVVHAHFWMSGRAALAATARTDVPVVQTFHALGGEKRRMQGAADTSPAERLDEETRIARSAERVVATASSEVFELCRLGVDPRRLKIVPCGVDVAAFSGTDVLPLPRRRPLRVVTLSRLVERKGVADVVEALRTVPEAELVVAGGPAAEELDHDAEARRLTRLSLAHGVADRVTLLGRVDRATVPALLRAADVVVCAAWYEPFGIVPLEAMACGVPVVATAVGGQTDTIVDGYSGIHVPPRRPGAIAHALQLLRDEPSLRLRLGNAGKRRARERYTWDRVAAETLAVYRGLERAPARAVSVTA